MAYCQILVISPGLKNFIINGFWVAFDWGRGGGAEGGRGLFLGGLSRLTKMSQNKLIPN